MPFNGARREGVILGRRRLPRKLDERSWLVVRMSRQDLNLLGGEGGAMLDELVVMLPAVSEPMGK